jgi:hypothetical protein
MSYEGLVGWKGKSWHYIPWRMRLLGGIFYLDIWAGLYYRQGKWHIMIGLGVLFGVVEDAL